MGSIIDRYWFGGIEIIIKELPLPGSIEFICRDKRYTYRFHASLYDYRNRTSELHQSIKEKFRKFRQDDDFI